MAPCRRLTRNRVRVRIIRLTLIVLAACLLPGALPASAQPEAPLKTAEVAPTRKPDGTKWRIGYLEGGPYSQYPPTLKATVKALAELGWMAPVTFPEADTAAAREDAAAVWRTLSEQARSEYLEFPAEAFWAGDWNEAIPREALREEVLAALDAGEVDLMIAMGTWAGQDLANDSHSVPTVVLSASDPLGAGIVPSVEDSGLDHLHARLDPTRYRRQLGLFHDIIPFRTLGVVYEDTVAGRTYAAFDDVMAVAEERGFAVETCTTTLDVNSGQAFRNLLACHEELAPKVDAVYLTENNGMQLDRLPELLAPLFAEDLPTFAMAGSTEVRHGVLLSIAQADFKYVGEFHAKIIAKILNGAAPRELRMVFEEPPKIAINLKTSEAVGFDPPVDILMAADEIYEDIAVAPSEE